MKKTLFNIVYILFLASVLSTPIGCNKDDNNTSGDPKKIEGKYILTSILSEEATDLNADGSFNREQLSESDCLKINNIELKKDNTFITSTTLVQFDNVANTLSCTETLNISGEWELSAVAEETAVIRLIYNDRDGTEHSIQLYKSGNEITLQEVKDYVSRGEDGLYFYNYGEVLSTFKK